MIKLTSKYDPSLIEDKWYHYWEENDFFRAEIRRGEKPYTIVIPPPNVTGILHLGHVLNNTLQDILIRWQRMQGKVTLWLPGTDHAGIATQNVVEKQLWRENLTRHQLGREKFVERVWQWKEQYGGTIIKQLRKLGCSCDWTREKFTLDPELSEAVLEAFIRLYRKNLIYRGQYIVNWCPRCTTAISDEEVEYEEVDGYLYYLKYPVKGSGEHIVVATTRPETMLGDVAVAVHPTDKRYQQILGKKIILPLVNRELEVIVDEVVDLEFGTGAVKVTPAHDLADWEMAQRHNLTPIVVMDETGKMNQQAGEYQGMDRFECREALLVDLKNGGFLQKIEPYRYSLGHCQRCHTVIEPYLSPQWFVKMKPLAEPALEAVKRGEVKFFPPRWTKVYFNWLENIRDWCISRQIWWGHRIPVYYCLECSQLEVAKATPVRCQRCGGEKFRQDEDVLDTWFSSWLWPFSTLGWPKKTEDLQYFYPTTTLITAPEIIFFWVARMIIAGLEFMKKVPFKEVYLHGIVRDEQRRKMSKSLGNSPDPFDLIKKFGTDALRFGLVAIAPQGQDILFSEERIQVAKFFANKIWNAARFVLMNIEDNLPAIRKFLSEEKIASLKNLKLADNWIITRFNEVRDKVSEALREYRFNEAAVLLNNFTWHEFCDWYLEISKLRLYHPPKEEERKTVQVVLAYVLEGILKLLHPYMPFITEEIWQKLTGGKTIMKSPWPSSLKEGLSPAAIKKMALLQEVIVYLRNVRGEMKIPQTRLLTVFFSTPNEEEKNLLENFQEEIKFLARVKEMKVEKGAKKVANSFQGAVKEIEIYIPKSNLIPDEQERAKREKEKEKIKKQLEIVRRKLNNPDFLKKAPAEIVAREREREKDWLKKLSLLE